MLERFNGRETGRRMRHPGTPGVFAIVFDVSGSMCGKEEAAFAALAEVKQDVPKARIFLFASEAAEWRPPSRKPDVGGGTCMHYGIEAAAKIQPSKTVIISDGGTEHIHALAAAEKLTGAIDTLWCYSVRPFACKDRDLMIDLARMSGGQARDLNVDTLDARAMHRIVMESMTIYLRGERHIHHHRPPQHVHIYHGGR